MSASERFHSLDAVRASVLIAGVFVHATSSFWPGFRAANWPISDDSSSLFLSALFFVLHVFRMSVFFVIAGFFAHLLIERLGEWGFIKNRLRRIALPLVAGMCLILPMLIVPFLWAQRKLGLQGAPDIAVPLPDLQLPPWGHLWFLYLLMVLYALWLGARVLLTRIDRRGLTVIRAENAVGTLISTGIAPLLFALPVAVMLIQSKWWLMWQGIPAPVMGFIPNTPAIAAYGSSFAFGWLLYRQTGWLGLLERRWTAYLAAAVLLTAVSLWLVGTHPQLKAHVMDPMARAVFAVAYLTAGWCWVFASIGAAQRFFARPGAGWRYISDASYFVYLAHLPVVYLLQTWMIQWPLHWSVKYLLIVTLTLVSCLVMYHYLVRSTFVGVFLNGRRHPRAVAPVLAAKAS